MGEKIIQKVKRLLKNKDRKLLEKYSVIDENSPIGEDENGLMLEEPTQDGADLLMSILWSEYRPKILTVVRKVEEEEDKKKKKKK